MCAETTDTTMAHRHLDEIAAYDGDDIANDVIYSIDDISVEWTPEYDGGTIVFRDGSSLRVERREYVIGTTYDPQVLAIMTAADEGGTIEDTRDLFLGRPEWHGTQSLATALRRAGASQTDIDHAARLLRWADAPEV